MATLNGLKLGMRTAPDFRIKFIKYLVTTSWIIALISLVFACFTLPPIKVFLNNFLKLNLPLHSNLLLDVIGLGLLGSTLGVSVLGAILNLTRNRRRSDHFYYSLVIIGILSGLGLFIRVALL